VRSSKEGFTLIEVLGVMAVVGLLISLLFPAIEASRRSSLQQRSRLQLLEIKSAIENYRSYYGNYPQFLCTYEIPLALNQFRWQLLEALQGGHGRTISPLNPHAVRFMEFSSSINGGDPVIDAFGNAEVYIILRHPDELAISRESFPERLRLHVPENGLFDSIAIYCIGKKENLDTRSWEGK
jgi:prepilin-type N-terminal cleavage/methylation domain-containing protein